jgi:catechol 2,3-dioxygenase-like lactoylglutathione lyase family enzyme
MAMQRLDHVNIRTVKLADSICFYRDALGMDVVPPPMVDDLSQGAYACDGNGHPVVHLVGMPEGETVEGPAPVHGKARRGSIDHFALKCSEERDAVTARLIAQGYAFDILDVAAIQSSLVFVRDPNEVMVELTFSLG